MAAGRVWLHREAMDHPVFQDDWLWRLFCWCIMRASYKDGKDKRGSFTTGRHIAAEVLGVSPSKFYRGIHKLQELGCISVEANSNWTTVTVCNYDTYQSRDSDDRTADEQQVNNERTASEQRADTDRKNSIREEGNKGRSNTFSAPSVDEVRDYCQERSNGIDPQAFVDYYSARGWMLNKVKMKDWRAAVRTWEKNHKAKPAETSTGEFWMPKAIRREAAQ